MPGADQLLHPVRLRITQRFLGDRLLTTSDLRRELPDVPVPSLYRHVALLVEAGVLVIRDERSVRGAVERTYGLGDALIGADEIAGVSAEEHRQLFLTFVSALVADFDRYLSAGAPDLFADRVGYRQIGLHLTDDELDQMVNEMSAAVAPYVGRPPGPGTRLRVLSTVLIPGEAVETS